MVASLPEFVDPLAFAEKNIRIKGELPVIKFTRIYELLYDYDGCVDFHLIFYKESNIVNIEGHITGSLTLKCQRCLEPLMWSIDSDFKLGVVNSFEGVNKLPEDFEPLMLQGQEKIALKDIIEDELLLVAPSVPKHLNNCLAENALGHDTGFSRGKANPEKNPFSILADFKNLENFNGSTKK